MWLAFALTLPALGQDVVAITLFRTGEFLQADAGSPVPAPASDGEDPFSILSVMEMSGEFLSDPDNLIFVRGVTLQPPTGALRAMDFFDLFGGFVLFDTFTSQSALESAYRAGNYQYTFGSLIVGDQVYRMPVPDASFPEAPHIVNFAAAQNVDPSQSFTLEWSPAAPEQGGATVEVFDAETGEQVYDSDTLVGAVSSAEIPANILRPGRIYEVEVTVTRLDVFEDGTIPSFYASAASMTLLPLKTGSDGGGELSIQSIILEPGGEVQLIIECQPGVPLEIQRVDALSAVWQTIQSETPSSSPAVVVVPLASFGDRSFLRVSQ